MIEEFGNRRPQFVEMRHQPVRSEFGDRPRRIAECDANHGHTGSARRFDVGLAVADHDRAQMRATQPAQGLAIGGRIGLGDADRIRPDDRPEIMRGVQRIKQLHRQAFQLIRTDAQRDPFRTAALQQLPRTRKQ